MGSWDVWFVSQPSATSHAALMLPRNILSSLAFRHNSIARAHTSGMYMSTLTFELPSRNKLNGLLIKLKFEEGALKKGGEVVRGGKSASNVYWIPFLTLSELADNVQLIAMTILLTTTFTKTADDNIAAAFNVRYYTGRSIDDALAASVSGETFLFVITCEFYTIGICACLFGGRSLDMFQSFFVWDLPFCFFSFERSPVACPFLPLRGFFASLRLVRVHLQAHVLEKHLC